MAGYGPGGDAMIPVGFGETATLPYFSNNAGYFWLYGVVLIPSHHAGAAQKLVHDAAAH